MARSKTKPEQGASLHSKSGAEQAHEPDELAVSGGEASRAAEVARADQPKGGRELGSPPAECQAARRPTKGSLLHTMLARPEGASMAALTQATGWQAHTVRAALTRLRQAGHVVERSRSEAVGAGETVYRIVSLAPAQAAAPAEGGVAS